ncbi:MAG TPA: ASKHA domain-containing protein, partial [bacterium]|nr:ASKHA domain-containing protein [bacterium]
IVLACLTFPEEDLEIEIPSSSRIDNLPFSSREVLISKEIYHKKSAEKFAHSPLVREIPLVLTEPGTDDNRADYERLKDALEESGLQVPDAAPDVLKRLPFVLRNSKWRVSCFLQDGTLLDVTPAGRLNLGIALDIGTTTLVAYLIDLSGRKILSAASCYNPQIALGEDVITRIVQVEEKGGMEEMHAILIQAVNSLILKMTRSAKIDAKDIRILLACGNTTMTHFFYKIPPHFIRRKPYIPAFTSFPPQYASLLNIAINPSGRVLSLPCTSSWIGGDITAGILAAGLHEEEALSLLIDLGTNGEVALGNSEWLAATSTSAGPCFEGSGITSGLRAVPGAIESFSMDGEKTGYQTIGGEKPAGICGTGLISLLEEMIRNRILLQDGRLNPDHPRVNGDSLLVVPKEETKEGKDILITEADIKNLMNAKGAIFAGIRVLLKNFGFGFGDLKHVYVSGGLGTNLDMEKAIFIGLLPDLPREKFVFLGNSAIAGAKLCLTSEEALLKTAEISGKLTYVDLSETPLFMDEFTAALFFPHTDAELFPGCRETYSRIKKK